MSSFEVNFWNTAGYSAPNAVPTAPAYQAVPSGLSTTGGGGSIGVAYTQGSPDPLTAFSTQSVPSLAYPGYPAGAAPDPLDDPLFGTYQQSPFYTNGGVNTIRVYVDYVSGGPPSNWNILLDFANYDATSYGAPSAGGSTTLTITGTKVGGGTGSGYSSWQFYESTCDSNSLNTGYITTPSGSSYALTGANTILKPDCPSGPADTVLGMLCLEGTERYTNLNIAVYNAPGGGDLFGFAVSTTLLATPNPTPAPTPTPPPTPSPTPAPTPELPCPNVGLKATAKGVYKAGKYITYSLDIKNYEKQPIPDGLFVIELPDGLDPIGKTLRFNIKQEASSVFDGDLGSIEWEVSIPKRKGGKLSIKIAVDDVDTTAEIYGTFYPYGDSGYYACAVETVINLYEYKKPSKGTTDPILPKKDNPDYYRKLGGEGEQVWESEGHPVEN